MIYIYFKKICFFFFLFQDFFVQTLREGNGRLKPSILQQENLPRFQPGTFEIQGRALDVNTKLLDDKTLTEAVPNI
jgi:hypothetical protein